MWGGLSYRRLCFFVSALCVLFFEGVALTIVFLFAGGFDVAGKPP